MIGPFTETGSAGGRKAYVAAGLVHSIDTDAADRTLFYPSAATMANARNLIIGWWETAYLQNDALRPRFLREAAAALPLNDAVGITAVYDALDWRRLRLCQNQQVPQWTPANALT